MADRLTRCTACGGRGYFHCECWPGDCICGLDDQDCEDCGGEGWIDPSYDYPDYDPPSGPTSSKSKGQADE
ncbi:hypothetical protein GCM10007923_63860 [Shinella yambaruensis]|uniref:Uncharacterized protein n=1 Tax=Shinella yambaruensis TaxID=415996 RepID=A0ABQ5ZQN3_9HYPH|nr:hypothetical protein GCM10007923_63860 [Shinella yambaruensis]